jgi:hypothetical protein
MKKLLKSVVVFVETMGIVGLIELFSKLFYEQNKTAIWALALLLSLLCASSQFDYDYSGLNKISRKIRVIVFDTKTIAAFFCIQIIIVVGMIFFEYDKVDLKIAFLSFGINLIGINLLILTGKLMSANDNDSLLRTPDGKVFQRFKNTVRHIPDPPTFELLGYNPADIIDISQKQLASYKIISPITRLRDMKLVQTPNGKAFAIVNDKLKHIPDPLTLQFIYDHRTDQNIETRNDLDSFETDAPFPRK